MKKNTAEIILKIYAGLAWLGGLAALVAGFAIFMVGTIGAEALGEESLVLTGFVGSAGIVTGLAFFALGVFEICLGVGLWGKQQWARIPAIVLSVLALFNVPLGTLIGAFGIYFFGFEDTVKRLLGGPKEDPVQKKAARPVQKVVKKTKKKATKKKSRVKKAVKKKAKKVKKVKKRKKR